MGVLYYRTVDGVCMGICRDYTPYALNPDHKNGHPSQSRLGGAPCYCGAKCLV